MFIQKIGRKVYPTVTIVDIVTDSMRINHEDDELYRDAMRAVRDAIDIAEVETSRFICKQTIEVIVGNPTNILELPIAPIISLDSVSVLVDDKWVEVIKEHWQFFANEDKSSFILSKHPAGQIDSMKLTFKVGYEDSQIYPLEVNAQGYNLPGGLRSGVVLLAKSLFNADGDASIGKSVNELPTTSKKLFEKFRILPYGRSY